jgi:aspartyl-tRNA(Asn)/glutamyl-tRNA(Gln) amidotransferase subunit B
MVKLEKIIKKYKIEEAYAKILISNLQIVEFFEKIIEKTPAKLAAPWVTVELMGMLNYNKKTLLETKISPKDFIQLLNLIDQKKITELKAKEILRSWKEESHEIKLDGMSAISNMGEIEKIVDQVIAENQKAVEDFKAGQGQALNFLIGQVMKISNKRADYQTAKNILEKRLK